MLDLSFSSLNYSLLASGGSDGNANVWKLPETPDEIEGKQINPFLTLPGGARGVCQVRWHPSAENILACVGASTLKIFDVGSNDPSSSVVGGKKKRKSNKSIINIYIAYF